MKKIIGLASMILFSVSIFIHTGCQKSNDDFANRPDYYRMTAYETGVTPEKREVKILFQVKDYLHDGVAGLTTEDFIVTENGGRIDSEANLKIAPDSIPFRLSTVLLLDVSSSVESFLPQIKEAAKTLIDQKLTNQQIAVYTFDSQPHLIANFSTDKQGLKDAIDDISETNLVNSTNLYGGIIEVVDLWEDFYSIDLITDGSLVLFTDGRHNATQALTLNDATAAIDGKKVYVAALDSPDLDEESLKTIANNPDRYLLSDDPNKLATVFSSIQSDIQNLSKSIYYMFYQSPISDPTPYENTLKVEIKDNVNPESDKEMIQVFNSEGFGG